MQTDADPNPWLVLGNIFIVSILKTTNNIGFVSAVVIPLFCQITNYEV